MANAYVCMGKLKSVNRWWTNLDEMNLLLHTPSQTIPFAFKINDNIAAQRQHFLAHGFDPKNPTKIISHGFTDTGTRFCKDFIDGMFY